MLKSYPQSPADAAILVSLLRTIQALDPPADFLPVLQDLLQWWENGW